MASRQELRAGRIQWLKCTYQLADVLIRSLVDDVKVVREARRAMKCRRNAADDDERYAFALH